jgi:hypothetical protein
VNGSDESVCRPARQGGGRAIRVSVREHHQTGRRGLVVSGGREQLNHGLVAQVAQGDENGIGGSDIVIFLLYQLESGSGQGPFQAAGTRGGLSQ